MKIENVSDEFVVIKFHKEEVVLLKNALNEVCNGIFFPEEFETRLGVSIDDGRALLAGIKSAIQFDKLGM